MEHSPGSLFMSQKRLAVRRRSSVTVVLFMGDLPSKTGSPFEKDCP
jgi:hypothetical protein